MSLDTEEKPSSSGGKKGFWSSDLARNMIAAAALVVAVVTAVSTLVVSRSVFAKQEELQNSVRALQEKSVELQETSVQIQSQQMLRAGVFLNFPDIWVRLRTVDPGGSVAKVSTVT
ncbi:hypothetical protein JWS13_39050 [Rhodococcus pseudokoreensis]|uniref:Cell division protein FtsL n=1 Tax=Rhodococcus pseudokoreensis TaxID=2811421 RepID=A0A974ZXJ0_9NOCA|nr:hypothetical protein [Rhodococcus pseudokoreensis]QSE94176.1 hypothetical protein JWS13_39050 [Rhodococcus pseudokoreensis]